ncbi:adenosine kinase-like isoform X1 [Homalodisca vitripennis]|uniref:adenosine kinase-like isoform X1 n=2 Tax=Homalodisca vitripennis TaxID=197043 RepID=UPI001EEB385A|nr:adenosine kinase-like isoform X1 [Homalodisca vitripennis]
MNGVNLTEMLKSHVIAGFGNPLLDIYATVDGNKILDKHNLKPDGQKEVNNDEFINLLTTLQSENYNMTQSPGGCTQNTLRLVQMLVNQPLFCVLFGGVGDDAEGKFLESEGNKCGLDTRYAKHRAYPTGRVVSLINGENRSLVAHLGAAEIYTTEDFITDDNMEIMEKVSIVYVEGFFISHSFEVSMEVVKQCKNFGVPVVFNLSGSYLTEIWPQQMIAMATASDIVIGNVAEFKGLANIMGLEESSVEDTALKVHSSLWGTTLTVKCKSNHLERFGKTVVLTRGKHSVLCVCGDRELIKFVVPHLDANLIKDTTGAGDAFAAGFLVAFLQNKTATECIAYGCQIAQQIIQNIGVVLKKNIL